VWRDVLAGVLGVLVALSAACVSAPAPGGRPPGDAGVDDAARSAGDAGADDGRRSDGGAPSGSDAVADGARADAAGADAAGPAPGFPPTPYDVHVFIEQRLESAKTPGAAACIVKDLRVAWCDGFGLAHIAQNRAPTPDTPFLLASISKTVTAVTLMTLFEDGLFALDGAVSGVLPFALAHPTSTTPITYRQLLTHTAGIRDNWDAIGDFYTYGPTLDQGADPALSLAQATRGYFAPTGQWYSATANFRSTGPGQAYEYANMGVALAGYLGEVLAARDFAALVRERVLDPLGLAHSSFRWSDVAGLGVAMPYTWSGSAYVAEGHYTFADYPDGGLFASARDLARFLLMIIGSGSVEGVRVLEAATVAQMLTAQVPSIEAGQGLVFHSSSWLGATWWGHSGGETGVATEMYFRPADGVGYVLLRNGDGDVNAAAGDAIAEKLVAFAGTL
jgi:CubicO group peptidase (beta-lactamase class C family)